MRGTVFALLVGLNDYGGRVSSLAGTHDDVLEFERFLEAQVPEARRQVRRLLDDEATRRAIIEGFTEHLSGARDGDVALFYFSGHGWEEPVAERYWRWSRHGGIKRSCASTVANRESPTSQTRSSTSSSVGSQDTAYTSSSSSTAVTPGEGPAPGPRRA